MRISAGLVVVHAESFWFRNDVKWSLNIRTVQLHAIFLLGLNLGRRFDGIYKLETANVSVASDVFVITLVKNISNSTIKCICTDWEWYGNEQLRSSLYMDPSVANLTWISVQGEFGTYIL